MIIFICARYLNCEKITTKEQICIFSTFFALTLTDPKVLNWQKQFFKYKKPTQEVLFVWMLLFWSAVKKIIDRVCRFWSSFCLEEATAQIHISTHPRGVFFRKKNHNFFRLFSPFFIVQPSFAEQWKRPSARVGHQASSKSLAVSKASVALWKKMLKVFRDDFHLT